MQRLEVSGAVRPIYGSLGVKWLNCHNTITYHSLWSAERKWYVMDVESYQRMGGVGDGVLLNFYPLPSYIIDAVSGTIVFLPQVCRPLGVPESYFIYRRVF